MDPLKFHTQRLTHSQEQSSEKNEKTSITTIYLKHWRSPGFATISLDVVHILRYVLTKGLAHLNYICGSSRRNRGIDPASRSRSPASRPVLSRT